MIKRFNACIPANWKQTSPPSIYEWIQRVNHLSCMEELAANKDGVMEKYRHTWLQWFLFQDTGRYKEFLGEWDSGRSLSSGSAAGGRLCTEGGETYLHGFFFFSLFPPFLWVLPRRGMGGVVGGGRGGGGGVALTAAIVLTYCNCTQAKCHYLWWYCFFVFFFLLVDC